MHVYIASKFSNKEAVRYMKNELHRKGHFVTHDWTNDDADIVPAEFKDGYKQKCAIEALRGIQKAQVFIMLAVPDMAGAHTELGIAIAIQIPVLILDAKKEGNQQNIFYNLPQCGLFQHVDSIDDMMRVLNAPSSKDVFDPLPNDKIVKLSPPNGLDLQGN